MWKQSVASKSTDALWTLMRHVGNQREYLHSAASQATSIPAIWRTTDQRDRFGHRWSGLDEPETVREIGFLDLVRRELRATVLLRLALTDERPYPNLLAAAPDLHLAWELSTPSQKTVSQIRRWPSSELRKAADFASQMGNGTPLNCALIRFPSHTFGGLPHEGIESVVLAFFPENGGPRSSAYRQVFVIVNGGISEFGTRRSLKTQHENLARHLIYNLRKHAEDVWTQATSKLEQIKTENDPSVVLHCLQRQAEAAKDCSYRLPEQWDSRLLAAAAQEFSFVVGCFLSACGSGPPEEALTAGRQRLTSLGRWLGHATWLDMLLSDDKRATRRAGIVLTNVIADICDAQVRPDPVILEAIAQRLGRQLEAAPFFIEKLTDREIRGLLHTYMKPWYSERGCIATVLETYRSLIRIEVRGEDEGELFRTSVPLGSLPDRPKEGDQYKLVVWDLWHHWFGIASAHKTGSVIPEWTPEKRRKFEAGLKRIKFGPVIERKGRS